MPALFFNQDQYDFQIPVSDQFILHDMPEANGNYVKVYLYVFRSFYRNIPDFSTAKAAEMLHMLESDVLQALTYWQKQGVLTLRQDGEQLWISFGASQPMPPRGTHISEDRVQTPPEAKVIRVERKPVYSPEEIEIYSKNPTTKRLFQSAEKLLGQPLGPSDMMILFGFLDYYRLDVDVILFLIKTCIESGNRSFRYMEKVAEDWSDHQIDSVEAAEKYTLRFKLYLPVYKALGMNYHTPNDVEQEYFDRWIYQYGFSLDIILEAARRTFQKTGKASFKYMEGILNPWYQQGVRNLSDIASLDQAFLGTKVSSGMSTNRKGSYFARSTTPYYDYETYERLAKPAPEESED
jgi:DnaD/phage-associated family protein